MCELAAWSNGKKIVQSGSLIGFEAYPSYSIEFREGDFSFIIKLNFSKNEQNKEQSLTSTVDRQSGTITLNCQNFSNTLGTGLTDAVEVATVEGKKVYFRFIAYDMEKLPIIQYAFFKD